MIADELYTNFLNFSTPFIAHFWKFGYHRYITEWYHTLLWPQVIGWFKPTIRVHLKWSAEKTLEVFPNYHIQPRTGSTLVHSELFSFCGEQVEMFYHLNCGTAGIYSIWQVPITCNFCYFEEFNQRLRIGKFHFPSLVLDGFCVSIARECLNLKLSKLTFYFLALF